MHDAHRSLDILQQLSRQDPCTTQRTATLWCRLLACRGASKRATHPNHPRHTLAAVASPPHLRTGALLPRPFTLPAAASSARHLRQSRR